MFFRSSTVDIVVVVGVLSLSLSLSSSWRDRVRKLLISCDYQLIRTL